LVDNQQETVAGIDFILYICLIINHLLLLCKKTPQYILRLLREEIMSSELAQKYKISKADFTRNRKQTFSGTLLFMMNLLRKSLSLEIENFVCHLRSMLSQPLFESFTKSAFVQCRNKIDPEVFVHLSRKLTEEFYTDNDASIKLWQGFRLLAVDGSLMTLPNTKELALEFGTTKNQHTETLQARGSVLYDVLNGFVLDGQLSSFQIGERALALKHLDYGKENDLIIYDRGYSSFDLVFEHTERNIDFLMRVKIDFNNVTRAFYESGKEDETVKIYPRQDVKMEDGRYDKNTFLMVRLLRIELSSGETEILMTSLKDIVKYPHSIFKELYSLRWGVETLYDELKNKLKVELFSGYSKHSIFQDFYATLLVSNVQSLIVGEINEELKKKKTTKYEYKVNNNLSYGFLKYRIISLLFSQESADDVFFELKGLFKRHLVPIRPDRKNHRDMKKYERRRLPKITKNLRDAI